MPGLLASLESLGSPANRGSGRLRPPHGWQGRKDARRRCQSNRLVGGVHEWPAIGGGAVIMGDQWQCEKCSRIYGGETWFCQCNNTIDAMFVGVKSHVAYEQLLDSLP